MIKPKRVTKKKKIIDALYIEYKELYLLKPNSCIGVNRIYFNTLANFALQNRITDEHFWNIIRKYEKYERYSYKLRYHTNCSSYHIMSLRDIYYLIHITKKKPWSITTLSSVTTFRKVNMTEEELEEIHKQVIEEYEQKFKGEKIKQIIKKNI